MFNPLLLYRLSRWLFLKKIPKIPSLFQRLNYFFNSCDIPPTAIIGNNVEFKHFGLGVVLNNRVMIEDNVIIMPHVVLGQHLNSKEKKPFIRILVKEYAMIGTGAKVIAKDELIIGKGVSIGANSVVTKSIADYKTVVGIPARVLN